MGFEAVTNWVNCYRLFVCCFPALARFLYSSRGMKLKALPFSLQRKMNGSHSAYRVGLARVACKMVG